MMPSRGWQLARGSAPTLFQAQCRNLSSATRRIQPRANRTSFSNQRIPQWRLSAPIAIASVSAIRHASTTPTQAPAATAQTATQAPPTLASAESTTSSFPNLDTITLDDIDLSTTSDIANIPEKIGYLHELGLNYGYGPTSMLEWAIEHMHMYTGLPWWGAVALTAVSIRLLMMPLYIKSSDMVARQSALMSVTKPISDRMTAAQKARDTPAVQQAWMEMRAVRKRAGLSMVDQMAPMVLQGIIGYCGFKLLRAMAALPVPALKTDGFLWLQDMTLSDPFLLLPIAMAGTIHLLVRMGGESGAMGTDQMTQNMRLITLYGMPVIILFATGFQSGIVCVWFASGGALVVVQSLALKNERVRQWLRIAPLYKPSKEEMDRGGMRAVLEGMYGGGSANASTASKVRSTTATMNPTYQSPNLRRSNSGGSSSPGGRVIDVNPVDRSKTTTNTAPSAANDDMIRPNQPPKKSGAFGELGDRFKAFNKKFQKRELTEEEMVSKRKDDFKRRAQAYEKRYQERRGK